jgi:hypothetical protein
MEGEEKRCRMCYEEGQSNTWNGYSEMGGRERKERGEILNKDGRGIRKESPEDK